MFVLNSNEYLRNCSEALQVFASLVTALLSASDRELRTVFLSVPDLPTVDRAITSQNGGRCRSETSERSKLGLRTGKERYILFITI